MKTPILALFFTVQVIRNILTGKGVKAKMPGQGVIRAAERWSRADHGF